MPKLLNWCEKCEKYAWACPCDKSGTTTTGQSEPNSIETRLASACFGAASANGDVLTDFVLRADGSGIGMAQFAGPAFQRSIDCVMRGE